MSNYSEKFEKMRVAGKLAAKTLDMLTDNIKEGISTNYVDNLGMSLFVITEDTRLHYTIVVLKNLYAHL